MRRLIWMIYFNTMHCTPYSMLQIHQTRILIADFLACCHLNWPNLVNLDDPLPLRAEDKGSSVSIYLCVMQFVSHWSRCFWSLRLMTVTETQPRSYTSQEQPETDTIRLVRDEWFSFAGLVLFFPPYHHCIYLLKEIKRFWKGHVLCFSVSI